jgi:hypothetical protein
MLVSRATSKKATSKNCATAMNLRRPIPTDITASAVAHLSLLALLLLFSEVHRFGEVAAETVAVDIVTPQEIAEKAAAENKPEPAPTPTPQLDFSLLDKPAAASTPAPASQPAAPARSQKQAAVAASRPAPAPAPSPPPAQSAPTAQAYTPPAPDLSIKYHVILGLPPDLPQPPSRSGAKAGDDFDAPAIESADIGSSPVTEFRRHLRTCSKLPADLKASDDVKVKLRVFMTQDGRLATDPVLIEASASAKGPLLMQGAISALQACQPYAMLPVDRYGEWKVLDLSFTPQDFSGS